MKIRTWKIFLSLNTEIEADVQKFVDICEKTCLSSFAYSLQLVIRHGLMEALTLSKPIAKTSHLSLKLYESNIFKERFEAKFGNKGSNSAVVLPL